VQSLEDGEVDPLSMNETAFFEVFGEQETEDSTSALFTKLNALIGEVGDLDQDSLDAAEKAAYAKAEDLVVGATEWLTEERLAAGGEVPLWMTLPPGPEREAERQKLMKLRRAKAQKEFEAEKGDWESWFKKVEEDRKDPAKQKQELAQDLNTLKKQMQGEGATAAATAADFSSETQVCLDGGKEENGVYYYCIKVTSRERAWQVWHRYSDFEKLYTKLAASYNLEMKELPRKHMTKSSTHPKVVQERKVALGRVVALLWESAGEHPDMVAFLEMA